MVENKKTPPEEPEDPEEPDTPDTPEGEVVVEGLTELPFTGMPMAVPIAGPSTVLGGLGLFILSLVDRKKETGNMYGSQIRNRTMDLWNGFPVERLKISLIISGLIFFMKKIL